jgi:DNA-binding NarL/FixJ family response regulator
VIRVLVVDDEPLLREAVRDFLADADDIVVIGDAPDWERALPLARELTPDVLLVDGQMAYLADYRPIALLRSLEPYIRFLFFSVDTATQFVSAALREGADGYLDKMDLWSQLPLAIRTVFQGALFVSPNLRRKLFGESSADRFSGA